MPAAAAARTVPAWLARPVKAPVPDNAPGFRDLMGELASLWSTRFAELSGTPVEMAFKRMRTLGIAQILEECGAGPICATMRAAEWNADIGMVIGRPVVTLVVEALFGGEGDHPDADAAPTLSPIEAQIAQVFARQVAEALQTCLATHGRASIRFDRLLPKPDFGALGKGEGGVGAATLSVSALGRTADFDLMFPLTLLDELSGRLDAPAAEATPDHDPRWSRQLGEEVGRALTRLRATIDLPSMSLGAVLGLHPGQVLALPTASGGKVKLSCGQSELFRCDLGQLAGHYTLRVEEILSAPPDAIRPHPANPAPT